MLKIYWLYATKNKGSDITSDPFWFYSVSKPKMTNSFFMLQGKGVERTKHYWFKGGFKVLWRHHTIISILSIYLRQTVQNSADKVSRWAAIFSPNFAKVLSSNSCVTSQTDLAFSLPSAVKCIIFFPFTHRTFAKLNPAFSLTFLTKVKHCLSPQQPFIANLL